MQLLSLWGWGVATLLVDMLYMGMCTTQQFLEPLYFWDFYGGFLL